MRIVQDITLGQYFPGDSFIHRLDPRTKLLALITLIITIFTADDSFALSLVAGFILLILNISPFSIPFLLKGVRLFFWLFLFTSVFHVFFTPGDSINPFPLMGLDVTSQGLSRGGIVFLQLFMVIITANIFTLTTEPMDLARGIEKILAPLKPLGFKVDEISLMISLVIRFIPILKMEAGRIIDAQRGRGVDFSQMPAMKKVRNLFALMGPLFTNLFARSDALVLAMASRGFGQGKKSGMLRQLTIKRIDLGAIAVVLVFSSLMIFKY